MPLPSSPSSISLNQIHVEAGGNSGTQCSLNDSDIRGLIGKSSSAQMSFNEWYGASSAQDVTMTSASAINGASNRQEQTASTWVSSGDTLIIPSNFWLWSDDTSVAALTIDVSNITLQNNGFIIGRGGDGGSGANADGEDGGPAIKINSGVTGVTITNSSGAYIAGGGGGGSAGGIDNRAIPGGGGGAGGGQGGNRAGTDIKQTQMVSGPPSQALINGYGDNVADVDNRNSSNNGVVANVVDAGAGGMGGHMRREDVGLSGGSGGRKLGSSAVGGYIPSFSWKSDGSATYYINAGGSGGANNSAGTDGGSSYNSGHAAGGGGGWGAAGGGNNENQATSASGGAGGAAIDDSGQTYSLTNNGTIWGST